MLLIGLVFKMVMSIDFGDKVIQVLIALIIFVIACFAWWTTNITEQPPYRTVFLLERRLRRRTSRTRLTTHIQSSSIGGAQSEEVSAAVGDNQTSETQTQDTSESKPPEASTSTSSRGDESDSSQNASRNTEEDELETIVQIMDTDANVVRLQRLAYYENQQGVSNTNQSTSSENSQEDNSTNVTTNIEEEPLMEHNYAERDTVQLNSLDGSQEKTTDSNIRIKLKYLNDELKLVDGRLEEQLGDFKRRHFQLEFSSNKLVRLIFNGQVLQPDTETLQSCGLFDNCVVHCLVHQQRSAFSETGNSGSFASGSNGRSDNSNGLPNNNNTGRDWDLGNVLFTFISIILGSAWYFRYEYAHLYTVTATVALVAITGLFSIFLFGVFFPDQQAPQPRVEQHSIRT